MKMFNLVYKDMRQNKVCIQIQFLRLIDHLKHSIWGNTHGLSKDSENVREVEK